MSRLHPSPAIRRRALPLAVIVVAVSLCAIGARASDESAFLYSQGLEEFRERTNGYRTALELFDRAVASDPTDVSARYYRGVTRARLGELPGAIDDLRWVLQERPGFHQAALELGIALVSAKRYDEAMAPLHQAATDPDLAAPASFYIGLAELHLGWLDQAERSFERATAPGAPAELALPTKYYLGVIAARRGRWTEARENLAIVAEARPDSDMGREAASFLRGEGEPSDLDYEAHGFAKLEYDSNVVLAPNDTITRDALKISRQEDGRARLGVGGSIAPWRTENAELRLGYDFGQILYFNLTEFNLQEHRPKVELSAKSGIVQVGLVGRYDYDLLETKSFLQQASALPWLRVAEGDFGRTELLYRARWRDFYQQRYSAALNAWNHAVSLQQFMYLGRSDRYVFVGYRFDRNQGLYAQGDAFSYDGNEGNAGVGLEFDEVGVDAAFAWRYRHESFDPASGGRRDDENAVTVQLRKALPLPHLFLSLEYFGTFHGSNQPVFAYDRQIASLGVEVEF